MHGETSIDNLVAHICMVYELVYPISVKIAKEQGYLNNLLQFESENPNTQEWFAYMREAIALI